MKKKKSKINNKMYILILIAFIFGVILSISVSYALAATLVNSKDVYYEDNSSLAVNNVQAAIDGTCTKFSNQLQEFLLKVYPVGSIYISYNSTNPGTLFGGTWENYGSGRVLRGINSGTAGSTGGSDTVTLKEANLPSHRHSIPVLSGSTSEAGEHIHPLIFGAADTSLLSSNEYVGIGRSIASGRYVDSPEDTKAGAHTHTVSTIANNTGYVGSGTSFSVQNSYITVYMWRRTK